MKNGTETKEHEVVSMSSPEMFGSIEAYNKFRNDKINEKHRKQERQKYIREHGEAPKYAYPENPNGMYRVQARKEMVLEVVAWIAMHKEILLLSLTGSEDFDNCLAQSKSARNAANQLQAEMLRYGTYFYGMDPAIAKHKGVNLKELPHDHVSIEDVQEFAFALSQMDKTDNFSMKSYLCVSNKRLADVLAQPENKALVEKIERRYSSYMRKKEQAEQPQASSSTSEKNPSMAHGKPVIRSLERVKDIENSAQRVNQPVAASSSDGSCSKAYIAVSTAYKTMRRNPNCKLVRQKAFNFGRDYKARAKALRI